MQIQAATGRRRDGEEVVPSRHGALGLRSEFTGHRFARFCAQGSCAPGQRIVPGHLARNRNRRQLTKKEQALPRIKVD